MSLNTHARLADTTTTKLAPLAITVANQLINDYGCVTAAERTLAETVANAYVRTLRYAEALNDVYTLSLIHICTRRKIVGELFFTSR